MRKFDLKELIGYNDSSFNPKVLVNESGYRTVLLNLRKGQSVAEHADQSVVTIYVLVGHITFYEGKDACELHEGEVVRIDAGLSHHLQAQGDSALYVLGAGKANVSKQTSNELELDLREVGMPRRYHSYPLEFRY